MRYILIFLLATLISTAAYSQSKIQAGAYLEAGRFSPKSSESSCSSKKGIATGGGIYGSYTFLKRCSVSLGAGYRLKMNKTGWMKEDDNPDYTKPPYYWQSYVEQKYRLHYLVVPLKLRYTPKRHFFMEAGMESAWLLNNYCVINEQTEYNWLFGVGWHLGHKVNVALNYIKGKKEQGFGNEEPNSGQIYTDRMFLLHVAYPLWTIKNRKC